jgi:hypothetical protein
MSKGRGETISDPNPREICDQLGDTHEFPISPAIEFLTIILDKLNSDRKINLPCKFSWHGKWQCKFLIYLFAKKTMQLWLPVVVG